MTLLYSAVPPCTKTPTTVSATGRARPPQVVCKPSNEGIPVCITEREGSFVHKRETMRLERKGDEGSPTGSVIANGEEAG